MSDDVRLLQEAILELYREGQGDYDLSPLIVVDKLGEPVGRINEGDSVICCCRRGEREVQLTRAFVDSNFREHDVKRFRHLTFVPLTQYQQAFSHLPTAFPPLEIIDTLGEVVSRNGLRQVRIAESEKFAHVTFFFNGGSNQSFPGQVDRQVPTRKDVPFADIPEMSIRAVTREAVDALRSRWFHLVVVNFANGDVIGHLDDRQANLQCARAIDENLGRLLEVAAEESYLACITADHGVFEQMTHLNGQPSLGHTSNPVPFILVDPHLKSTKIILRGGGVLANIAPTVLEIMGLPKPKAMTQTSLIQYRNTPGGMPRGIPHQTVLLLILDGCGIGRPDESNPLFCAPTPVLDSLMRDFPFTELKAAGESVGLKKDKKGNSEAGHMNIAAGRIVPQDDVRIDRAIKDGSFYKNEAFLHAIGKAQLNEGALHLLALLSKQSSHGSMDYALEVAKMAQREGLKKVFIHLIFDGRSTEPGSAPKLLAEFAQELERIGVGRVVTGMGRAFALDRDGNYQEKTRVAYEALAFGKGKAVRESITSRR